MFSLRRSDRELLSQSGRRRDQVLTDLIGAPRRLLATLLIGNESANVAISAVMAGFIERYFSSGNDIRNALLATCLTLPLLLFFGEIGPKTVAINASLAWSRRAARPLWAFGVLVTPLRFVVRTISDMILGKGAHAHEDISEEEFRVLVDAGSAEGEVDDRERNLIHKVFEFADKTVADAMQKRNRVFALAYGLPLTRLVNEIAARGYSRVPIYDRNMDNIRGVLYAKDLVIASCQHTPPKLSELLHEPFFVPRSTSLERLFSIFKQGKTHMALVVDEYGTLVGIVTMEDLLEELFGEISDERELQKSMSNKLRQPTEPVLVVDRPAEGRS